LEKKKESWGARKPNKRSEERGVVELALRLKRGNPQAIRLPGFGGDVVAWV